MDKTLVDIPSIDIEDSVGFIEDLKKERNKLVKSSMHFWKPEDKAFNFLHDWQARCLKADENTADHGPLMRTAMEYDYDFITEVEKKYVKEIDFLG